METRNKKIFYDDHFLSLEKNDHDKNIILIILKDDLSVYTNNIPLPILLTDSGNHVTGIAKTTIGETIIIVDEQLNEAYAEIEFKENVYDMTLNDEGFYGWITANNINPFHDLETSVKEYLSRLKDMLT